MEVVADTVGSIGVLIAGSSRSPRTGPTPTWWSRCWSRCGCCPGRSRWPRGALRILSESSPSHIDVEELRAALAAVDGVTEVHDLHVWTLVPGKDMVTAHLTSCDDSARVLDDARAVLAARGLEHATVQIEPPGDAVRLLRATSDGGCQLRPRPARARRVAVVEQIEAARYSSVSPIASAARASAATQRRNPRLGSCEYGTGPKPFQPLRRN